MLLFFCTLRTLIKFLLRLLLLLLLDMRPLLGPALSLKRLLAAWGFSWIATFHKLSNLCHTHTQCCTDLPAYSDTVHSDTLLMVTLLAHPK